MNADRDGSIPFRFARDHFRLLPLPSRVRDHPHKEEESDLPQTTSMCSYERIRLANTRISRASPSRGRSRKSCARVENTQKYGQIQRKNKQILLPMEPKYRPRARSTLHPHPRDFFFKNSSSRSNFSLQRHRHHRRHRSRHSSPAATRPGRSRSAGVSGDSGRFRLPSSSYEVRMQQQVTGPARSGRMAS